MDNQNKSKFPEQEEPGKIHGTHDDTDMKEKYIRDSGKIEDMPDQQEVAKMNSDTREDSDAENVSGRSDNE